MGCCPPGSSVHGIFQTRILEWLALPYSRGSFWPKDLTLITCITGGFFTHWAIGKPIYMFVCIYVCVCVCVCVKEKVKVKVMSDSLQPHGLYSSCNSAGQNTGVGSHSLLQGIFPTQGSNPGIPHCRWILYQLSHQRSPRILAWVPCPFFRGSSWPRNWTGVSCIAGGFFTNWATREAHVCVCVCSINTEIYKG